MEYQRFPDLVQAYLDSLSGRACYTRRVQVAAEWIRHLTHPPTRTQLLERHRAKGHGDFQPGSTQANAELALIRAACRWGIYHERWTGGDPTVGIKKWRTAKRRTICKYEHLKALLARWTQATTPLDMRDRALFGIMLLTGCRPSEIRHAKLGAIVPYGSMGCWRKPTTKTGEPHEIPIPSQAMGWLVAYMAVRAHDDPRGNNPYLFPGQAFQASLASTTLRDRGATIRRELGSVGLWNYDLRRTMASYLGNELHYDDKTIQAVLNHHDGRALSHYYHVSFDALTTVVQRYADWVFGVGQDSNQPAAPARARSEEPPIIEPRMAVMPKADGVSAVVPVSVSPTISIIPLPLDPLPAQPVMPPLADPPYDTLSRREREVFVLFSQGQSTRTIAQSLGISQTVASSYCRRIKKKLQLTNTSPLLRDAGVSEADRAGPTPRPVSASAIVAPVMPAPRPIIRPPRRALAREEWPG